MSPRPKGHTPTCLAALVSRGRTVLPLRSPVLRTGKVIKAASSIVLGVTVFAHRGEIHGLIQYLPLILVLVFAYSYPVVFT